MNNVSTKIENDKLIITIDMGKAAIEGARPSASGKTVLVASTGGAVPLSCAHAAVSLSLNVMAKRFA
jgi:hypothetical protein